MMETNKALDQEHVDLNQKLNNLLQAPSASGVFPPPAASPLGRPLAFCPGDRIIIKKCPDLTIEGKRGKFAGTSTCNKTLIEVRLDEKKCSTHIPDKFVELDPTASPPSSASSGGSHEHGQCTSKGSSQD